MFFCLFLFDVGMGQSLALLSFEQTKVFVSLQVPDSIQKQVLRWRKKEQPIDVGRFGYVRLVSFDSYKL